MISHEGGSIKFLFLLLLLLLRATFISCPKNKANTMLYFI